MPVDYQVHARSAGEAVLALSTGLVTEISLDYDLGTEATGHDVAQWIAWRAEMRELRRLKWHIHSDNCVGREKILREMDAAERWWAEADHDADEAECCACGRRLHYTSPVIEKIVRDQVADLGEWMPVTAAGVTYLVQRHYIALHGLKADELPLLLLNGIVRLA